MATHQAPAQEFFNLHTSGIGYLNRVRWVQPGKRSSGRRSEPFLACSISALRGSSDDVSYTYFDVRVSGQEAIQIVDKLREAVQAQRKVVVAFRIGDIYPHLYERDVRDPDRKPTGQKEWAVLIKGRLLLVNSVSVDGEKVYSREPASTEADDAPDDEARDLRDAAYDAEEAPVREEELQPRPQMIPPPAAAAEHRELRQPGIASGSATPSSRNRPAFQRNDRNVGEEVAA